MLTEDHVETEKARALRSARQHFAAPGGRHDRLVAFLARALPMGVGVIAALMIITPLSPRGEISFLLDRNKVAMIDERLSVDNAMYRGQDDEGRPFSLQAGEAVQRSSREGVVRMTDLVARLLLNDGPARLTAESGAYTIDSEVMRVFGPVRLTAADGYRMVARDVSIDLKAKTMVGQGGVDGEIPAGTFSSDRLVADLSERTITLDGNARLRMVPGQLRMPQ
ncbi:MAG: LPS export ABC transporter periplasmic protein LptC [Sphingomonadaceae bacterium]|nr:LPS export ABC transporter periplasmic protein LptC [Sphingomonadaceae bacterium]